MRETVVHYRLGEGPIACGATLALVTSGDWLQVDCRYCLAVKDWPEPDPEPQPYDLRVARVGQMWAIQRYEPCNCPDCPVEHHWNSQATYHYQADAEKAMSLKWKVGQGRRPLATVGRPGEAKPFG